MPMPGPTKRILRKDRFSRPRTAFKYGMAVRHDDNLKLGLRVRGDVFFHMVDARTGEVLLDQHQTNIITLDAGILVARLLKDPEEPAHGINMLAVGTGATGALLSPDAPDSAQRKLNAEIARKAFVSTTFRDGSGNAVSIPTNIVDYTTTFGEAEAVGPLNEMGLISSISANSLITNHNPNAFPTRDVTLDLTIYDILVNYLTFSVISKPSTAILTLTWRITT
jgi:hypothetical protein